jgi:hypothetical protein
MDPVIASLGFFIGGFGFGALSMYWFVTRIVMADPEPLEAEEEEDEE